MKKLSRDIYEVKEKRPTKVLQFGQGNFLRAFVDYMIDIANEKNITNIGVAIVKPIPFGSLEDFNNQDNLFTVNLKGISNGEVVNNNRIITCVNEVVNPFSELENYEEIALSEDLEFIVSNTTEAGIVFDKNDDFNLPLPETFPGKVTKILFKRFKKYSGDLNKGLIFLPCELIESNGDTLKKCILDYINLWSLGDDFKNWVLDGNVFTNTLVDRIVPGFPKDNTNQIFEQLGYEDNLLVVAEPFGFWVIESEKDIKDKFPLNKAGEPVLFTNNLKPYRDRKVRILNGAHTAMVPISFLTGQNIVRECMQDETIKLFLDTLVKNEIIPTLSLPENELLSFSNSVMERFENPFINHNLLDISLNSISKWTARILPSFKEFYNSNKKIPKLLTFSLAGLLSFYRSDNLINGNLVGLRDNEEYLIKDDLFVLEFFKENSKLDNKIFVQNILSNKELWSEDLTEFDNIVESVVTYLDLIKKYGANESLGKILKEVE